MKSAEKIQHFNNDYPEDVNDHLYGHKVFHPYIIINNKNVCP
jgi:hypothetical protein